MLLKSTSAVQSSQPLGARQFPFCLAAGFVHASIMAFSKYCGCLLRYVSP